MRWSYVGAATVVTCAMTGCVPIQRGPDEAAQAAARDARVLAAELREREQSAVDDERRQRELDATNESIRRSNAAVAAQDAQREKVDRDRRATFAATLEAERDAREKDCAPDRTERSERHRLAQDAIDASVVRRKAAETWLAAHCTERETPTYTRELCDDGSATPKWCKVEDGSRTEYRCLTGAPPGVSVDGAERTHTPSEQRAVDAEAKDGERNRKCGDVPRMRM